MSKVILMTQLFRDIVRKLPRHDIVNLCKIDKYFYSMCKKERNFINRELDRRVFYITLETDLDEIPGDWVHEVTISKTKPAEMFGDFFQTKRFEVMDYNVDKIYILFHFTDDNYADVLELYTDKETAENEFYKQVDVKYVNELLDGLDFTISDENDVVLSRWRLVEIANIM